MKNDLTFIIPNYETPDYMQWCYNSIRKNLDKEYNILIIDDGSEDGSWDIIQKLKEKDNNLTIVQNNKNYGIAYTYNQAVDHLKTEYFVLLHTDMYIPPGFDKVVLDNLKKYDFVTTFRTEPRLYPSSPDKLQMDFGNKLSEFNEGAFLNFVKNYKPKDEGMLRTCFPWATSKKVFNRVNGVDELLLRYMCDDDDLYLRIAKAEYNYWQDHSHPGVYHMTSRTTKYRKDDINIEGSTEWNNQYTRSTRNFIRKWGRGQNQAYNPDMSMNTNLVKYDIGYVIRNCDANILYHVEPWANTIYVNIPVEPYIEKSQKNTMYDLRDRVKYITEYKTNNIIINFDGDKLNNENFKLITQMQDILQQSGDINGLFELDIFKINVKSMEPVDKEWLISGGFRNTNGYNL